MASAGDFVNEASNSLNALGNIPQTIEDKTEAINAGMANLSAILTQASSDPGLQLAVQIGQGLSGDGTVTVQHEGVNIAVHFKVNIDSKDLAAALGDDAEGGPFFVINTDRDGGGTGSAEAAGA
mgnify:CR=1 FL=1